MADEIVRVLIVDDDRSIRQSLAMFLEDYDFEVSQAGSGEEALELLPEFDPDVAIVDLRLPDTTGDVLIQKLHALNPSTRFLIYTGSTNFQITEEIKAVGLSNEHILSKPQNSLGIFIELINDFQGLGR